VVVAGLSTVGTGLLLYSVEPVMSSLVGGGLVRLLFGLGMGCVMAPATESIMGSLPKAKAGVGSAVNDTTRQAGGALGVAVIGSVFAATYHRVITVPAGLPGAAVPMVHDSIGSALEAITRYAIPGELATAVHDAASSAFFRGMQVAAWSGAAVMVCAVVVAYKYLPARSQRAAVRTDDELDEDTRLAASLDDGMLT